MEILNSITERFERLAYKRSQSFCYSCYKVVILSHCPTCGSDDFMRFVAGDGVEYGVDWIIRSIVRNELTAVDTSEAFEETIRECYAETTKVAWIEVDTIRALRDLDPISFEIAANEWIDQETSEENLITFDNGTSYYWAHDLEAFLDEQESLAS